MPVDRAQPTNSTIDTKNTKNTKNPQANKTPQAHVRLDTPDTSGHAASPQPPGARTKLPHERDESVGMTGGVPSGKMQQAHRDVTRGVQDTDRGPEADRTYQKQKR